MLTMPRSFITESTFRFLEPKLDDTTHHDDAYLRLLRNKLSNTVILSPMEFPPEVATINSRINFSVDNKLLETRVLVRNTAIEVFGLHLPITTLRGLALLGLTTGDAIEVTRSDGTLEVIYLAKVCYQPEAHHRMELRRMTDTDSLEGRSSAFLLESAGQAAHFNSHSEADESEENDPGPQAA